MSRFTKLVVIASNLLAVWLVATLVSRGLPSIFIPTLTVFVASLLAALFWGDVVIGIVLSTVYLVPAACFVWFNTFVFSYYAIWLAGLSGAMLPRAVGSKWAYPAGFSAPLVLWALTLALSWPLVAWRELDFSSALLQTGMPTRLPQSPGIVLVWVATVASIALTGLLMLDWLFLRYPSDRLKSFETQVIWPLFAGASVAAVVAVYQAVVDISFLNHTFFEGLGRVVGTMRDANAFGAAAALWVPLGAAMALGARRRLWAMLGWCTILVAFVTAVWASGSRTALLAAMIGLFVVILHAWRSFSRRQLLAGALSAIVLCAAVVWVVPSTTIMRVRAMVPGFSRAQLQDSVAQLWSRDMYGTTAVKMITEHPFVGVGVGGFNYQYGDVLYRINGSSRPPDNAQNWYRQQLAELGVMGSLGWIAWLVMFTWMLARSPYPEHLRLQVGAAEGAILGLAAASLLGIPTQDAAPSISLVVVMCWCMHLKGVSAEQPERTARPYRLEWAAILLVLACFLGGTVAAAQAELLPSLRALQMGFPYRYGLVADQTDPALQWTGAAAVEVFSADKRWLKLVVGDVAPDAADNPVRVRIWIDGTPILDVRRRGNFPVERWVRMPAYGTPVMMRISVGRTWRTSGGWERGVALREFAFYQEDPPKGSVTFESPELFH